jgi:hypothetical protein
VRINIIYGRLVRKYVLCIARTIIPSDCYYLLIIGSKRKKKKKKLI